MKIASKPSEVLLDFPMPFVGGFRKAESELMAAMMIRALVRNGDEWGMVRPSQIGTAMRADIAEDVPWVEAAIGNPFCRPHPHRLVEDGYAAWEEGTDEGTRDRGLSFTPRAMEVFAGFTPEGWATSEAALLRPGKGEVKR